MSITCLTSHLGNPSSSPDQFIIEATPGLVEAPGRDGVSVLAYQLSSSLVSHPLITSEVVSKVQQSPRVHQALVSVLDVPS